MPKIAKLRQKITLQGYEGTTDQYGGVDKTWSDIASPRAAVERIAMREYWNGFKLTGEADYGIQIRYRDDFDLTSRVVLHGGVACRIVSIINADTKQRWLWLIAKEIEAENEG